VIRKTVAMETSENSRLYCAAVVDVDDAGVVVSVLDTCGHEHPASSNDLVKCVRRMDGVVVGYHSDTEYWSRSAIVEFAQGREDADFTPFFRRWISRVDPRGDDTDALRVGKGTHAIALKDALEMPKMVRIPDAVLSPSGRRSGNAWTKFRIKNAGKTLLTSQQFALCERLADALRDKVGNLIDHPAAKRELEHRWLQNGLPCRLKADLVVPDIDGETYCIDLKTARSVNRRALRSEIRDRKLWLQDAHYSAGLRDLYGMPVRFLFAAVEKHGCHRVKVLELEPETRHRAADAYGILVEELRDRLDASDWVHPDSDFVEVITLSERDLGVRRLTKK